MRIVQSQGENTVLFWFIYLPMASVFILGVIHLLAKFQLGLTFCDESDILVVEKGGKYSGVVYSIEGWVHDDEIKRFVPGTKDEGWLERLRGIHVFGFPFFRSIRRKMFSWNEWVKGDGTQYKIKSRNEMSAKLKWQNPYGMPFEKIEIQGQIKVDFDFLVTLRFLSPYNGLYKGGGKWLEITTGMIQEVVKEQMGQYSIDQLQLMKTNSPEKDSLIQAIMGLNNDEKLLVAAGQEIIAVQLLGYEQVGAEAMKQAAQKEEEERLKAKGVVAAAQGELDAAELRAQAVERLATAQGKELEETVLKVATAGPNAVEALKWVKIGGRDAKLTTYVEGGAKANINVDGK